MTAWFIILRVFEHLNGMKFYKMYTGCFSHFSFSFSFYDISKGVAVHWIYHETCKWNTFKNTLNCVVKRCNYFFLNIEDERRAAEVNRLGQMKALLSHDEHDHPMENVIHNYLKRRRYHLQAAGGLTGCNETDCFFFSPRMKKRRDGWRGAVCWEALGRN